MNSLDSKTEYFDFFFTEDGSVGLYNRQVEDIYHSKFGAALEACEKFITPLEFEKNFAHLKKIKILDICFGIGYNTKSLMKKIIQTKYKGKVEIDILEYDRNLVSLSPFIKDSFFKSYPEISFTLLNSLGKYAQKSSCEYLNKLLSKPKNKKYFEPFYIALFKRIKKAEGIYTLRKRKQAFLHNIYYHCISSRNKKAVKPLRFKNFIITPYFDDARQTIKHLNSGYNIIFLDAFTPSKLPTLWSLEFFKQLYRLAHKDSLLVTYSNSVAVRHAMTEAGFITGKLYDKNNRHCGTIASPDSKMIKITLDEYDKGLMQTRAGIYYRDHNLETPAEKIIENWKHEKETSKLESSSQYIKRYKTENRNEI